MKRAKKRDYSIKPTMEEYQQMNDFQRWKARKAHPDLPYRRKPNIEKPVSVEEFKTFSSGHQTRYRKMFPEMNYPTYASEKYATPPSMEEFKQLAKYEQIKFRKKFPELFPASRRPNGVKPTLEEFQSMTKNQKNWYSKKYPEMNYYQK
jgi:preprotein translocase subunit Sss1